MQGTKYPASTTLTKLDETVKQAHGYGTFPCRLSLKTTKKPRIFWPDFQTLVVDVCHQSTLNQFIPNRAEHRAESKKIEQVQIFCKNVLDMNIQSVCSLLSLTVIKQKCEALRWRTVMQGYSAYLFCPNILLPLWYSVCKFQLGWSISL